MSGWGEMEAKNVGAREEGSAAEDAQVEAALRNFRESVQAWSERETARPYAPQPRRRGVTWWMVQHTGAAWALAVVLVVAGISVPEGVHLRHEEQRVEAQKALDAAARVEQQRLAEAQVRTRTLNDEEFLKDVDSDIAQGTPDAMEPLASLMGDSAAR